MRRRYIVYHAGRAIGWVHAVSAIEAIMRVAKMTKKPADECAALLFEVRQPHSSDANAGPSERRDS
jgi:hypothetical protein